MNIVLEADQGTGVERSRPEGATTRPRIDSLKWAVLSVAFLITILVSVQSRAGSDLSRLLNLLDVTPEGGWVQVNTNKFSDIWVTGPDALPNGSYSNPATIIHAWSSFAWDSNRGNLLLWGGGHANYMGNEIYVWQGTDGAWTRGSLPSRVETCGDPVNYFTSDNATPQSAHTYDNNIFAPVNDMFVTFGGAAFQNGGNFTNRIGTCTPVRAGPWAWDPRKADPNKTGGTTGSGYNPATPGGQMWTDLRGRWVGADPPSHGESTTGYRLENGADVFYVTGNSNSSGWPSLYRYEVGDIRAGTAGRFERVAVASYVPSFQAAAVVDTLHGLYIRTSDLIGFPSRFGVWVLARSNPAAPYTNPDVPVDLVLENGSPFKVTRFDGIAYDEINDKILLWDGEDRGTVWETQAVFDQTGNIASPWIVRPRASTTSVQPEGQFVTGVLGKWHFIKELAAFIALDEFNYVTDDAAVWLYKPYGWQRPPGGANSSPSVSITSPANGASYVSPATISLVSVANDADGTVAQVAFFQGGNLIGIDNTSPYEVAWSNVGPGSYSLTARATDNLGATTTSAAVTVRVSGVEISSSRNPSTVGESVSFTATVHGDAPTGTVAFRDGGSPLLGCNAVALVGGVTNATASCAVSALSVGAHSIVVEYSGDARNSTSFSGSLSQIVTSASAWVDDSVPTGATLAGDESWTWVSSNPTPYSGGLAHRSSVSSGIHQHYFYGAGATLSVGTGETLFAYVYLDPANPPSEVMLQWNDGSWEHRAYWGANLIPWGTDGTVGRRYMGALPAVGQWVRLEVPASQVGLEGRTLNGMAFTLYGGRATWDAAGKAAQGKSTVLAASTFDDVSPTHIAEGAIRALLWNNITQGCATNPLRYCPDAPVTRSEMAVFLERAKRGIGYLFTPTGAHFADVAATHWAAGPIEQLYLDGITNGCAADPLRYCPDNHVTRAQMAPMLLKARYGNGFVPESPTGMVFSDIPSTHLAAAWIEEAFTYGITVGCTDSPRNYCPDATVSRAQMALFLQRTFSLAPPPS